MIPQERLELSLASDKWKKIVEKIEQKKPTTAVEILQQLEWSGRYSYCTGWSCCPVCKGIKPGHGVDPILGAPDNTGHRKDCDLAIALLPPTSKICI